MTASQKSQIRKKGQSAITRRDFVASLLCLPALSAVTSAVTPQPSLKAYWLQTARHSYCVDAEYSRQFLNAFFFNQPQKEVQ